MILKDLETIPEGPVAAPGQGAPLPPLLARGMMALATRDRRTLDLNRYLAELDAAEPVKEVAHDPNELFSKLDDWGLEALVIPHGTTWGIYTPPVYDWRKQLEQYHDPDRQTLVEVYSGHGNSERWIDSAQYMLAMTDFSNPAQPRRLDFGFIAASDNHSARPGTGYKEINWEDVADVGGGGLVALHSESRRRTDIWDALQRKETYGTSGPRILLWFDLLQGESVMPMGSSVERGANPSFTVRAVGSFEQEPGCPSHATEAAGRERLEALCQNECYNPSDQRRRIERIEIVRIRPQQHQGEALDPLIEDAWRVAECPEDDVACEFTFTDTDYADTARDTIYYARAIESAIPTLNGANLAPVQHRAWSSPIFVNYRSDQLE